ncbi:fibrinogen-like protein 1 [Drosophila ficusphila]|uniref:fibrinogen-like protein 1 n=1 Tax=Drosophila ficusphila TaxID=30025 RepID=UPI0007E5C055|nr:fibrinogen-like protein 1 [Drosophila ficusphila]
MQSKGLNRIKSQQIKEMQEALQQCSKNQETKPIQDASLNSVKIQEQNPVQEVNLNNCKNQEQNPVQEVNLNNCRTELNQTAAMITSLRSQYETCEKLVENLKREQLEKSSTTEAPQPLQNNAVLNQKEQINLRTCTQFENSTGVQSVKVPTMGDVSVFCDSQIAGSGWLVIQRRLDGKTDFNRNWTDYRDGFGNLTGEFFIGLETLNQITKSEQHELFIQLEDFEGEKRFARYDRFEVGDENSSYRLLSLGEYSGNAGDALTSNLLAKFSTNDQDTQDRCASLSDGAWWYGSRCGFSNLNGVYSDADTIYDYDGTGIYWSSGDWHDTSYSLKTVHMMIRPKAP